MRHRTRLIVVLHLAIGIVPAAIQQARAQDGVADKLPAFKSAIAALAKLQSAIGTTAGVVSSVRLGPYDIGGSCGYDCLGSLCFMTQHWSWKTDFSGTRVPLQNVLNGLTQQNQNFDQSFAPIRTWLKISLPTFSGQFTDATNQILSIDNDIRKAGGTATPAQRNELEQQFQSISDALQRGSTQLNPGIQSLAQYNQQVQAYQGNIDGLRANLQSSVDNETQRARDQLIDKLHCGQGDASNQFNSVRSQFDQSFQTIQNSFNDLHGTATSANDATATIIGTLVNIQSRYQVVSKQMQTAQQSPNIIIDNLHLTIAQNAWKELADFAVKQLN